MDEIKKLTPEQLAELRQRIRNMASADTSQPVAPVLDRDVQGDGAVEVMPVSQKQIEVVVAQDNMSATVWLADPGEEKYTVPEIIEELRKNRVVVGINTKVIMQMVNDGIYNTEVEAAKGKPLVPTQEGYYEYFFDAEEHKKPMIREDGTTDYSAVGRFENVKDGQLLAKYHPAIPGKNGYDILGHEMVAKIAKEKPLLRGKNIRRDDNTNEYFATMSGKISLKENNIEILDVLEINENITLIRAKVEFFGDLYINGDVENGVVIRAGRNVVVNGTVGAATINAGGDIILQRGITGAGRGRVSARGNIFSDFIEHAKVEAGQDIYANSIINSEISTGGNVIVSGKNGSIIGGNTHGLRGIVANAAGSESEVRTVLHAGFLKEDYTRYLQLEQSEKKTTNLIQQRIDELSTLLKARAKAGSINSAQKEKILDINRRKDNLKEELQKIKFEKEDIGRRMSMGANASIIIRGNIFRNVLISIDAARLAILKEETYVRFVCRDDEIQRRAVPRDL